MIVLRCCLLSAVLALAACAATPKEDSSLEQAGPHSTPGASAEINDDLVADEFSANEDPFGDVTLDDTDVDGDSTPVAETTDDLDTFDEEFEAAQPATNALQSRDKFESFNRAMFSFNMTLDRWILKPVAKGYQWLAPAPVETGVSNFFYNLLEIRNVFNDVLQWKWKQAGNDTGRFLLNSTVGIAGIFDVARHAGLERSEGEDFGQTLAVWGVPQGPYLMLPVLGPYTVASAAGFPVDWVTHPVSHVDSQTVAWSLVAVNQIQGRAQLLESEKLASGDLYIFIRDAFLQRRDFLVNDGVVVDDFGGDFGEEDEAFDF